MDLENIIYIVVTIVIFVVSLTGKSQKKTEPVVENLEEEEYSLNEFEKILERKHEYIKNEEEEISDNKTDNENLMEMGQAVTKLYAQDETTRQSKSERKNKERKEIEDDVPDDGFDVKSAIIYSSILERKNFRN